MAEMLDRERVNQLTKAIAADALRLVQLVSAQNLKSSLSTQRTKGCGTRCEKKGEGNAITTCQHPNDSRIMQMPLNQKHINVESNKKHTPKGMYGYCCQDVVEGNNSGEAINNGHGAQGSSQANKLDQPQHASYTRGIREMSSNRKGGASAGKVSNCPYLIGNFLIFVVCYLPYSKIQSF